MQPDPRATAPDERTYAVEGERVVHETIDGETILIALDTGVYYSLTGSGPEMWALLCGGHSIGVVRRTLAERYPDQAEQAQMEVLRLAQELEGQGLLVESRLSAPGRDVAPHASGAFALPTFAPATLHRYTDAEYFLLLDPIHEVDATKGWPVQADGTAVG